jgi:hypothetical protein
MKVVPVAARLSFAATLATALVILGTALSRQQQLIGYPLGHLLLVMGTVIGLIALVLGFVWWIGRLKTGETSAARWGYVGLVGAIALMIVPLNTIRLAFTMPELRDLTTDPETPPALNHIANPPYDGQRKLSYDGEILSAIEAQKRAYPEVRPVKVIQPDTVLYWRAFETAKKAGWDVSAFDKSELTIEASHENFWSGNVSDIAIRVRRAGMGARLDIRARSRFGSGGDAGANAALIKGYFKELSGK